MKYDTAFLNSDGMPSGVRVGEPVSENEAAHRALRLGNMNKCDMCVVEHGTNKIVQMLFYHLT